MQDQNREHKESNLDEKHIDHDTSDAVLDLMEEFAIPGDELNEPKQQKTNSETSSE